jgi:hypothetical protein
MKFDPRSGVGTVLLGRTFVSQYAETPLRLATLIMHELLHHLLHHYVLYPSDPITNIAQDSLINGLICRLAPSFQQLFTDYYDKHTFPEMMLRPGANLKRIEDEEIREMVRSCYRILYRKANRWTLKYYASNPKADVDVLTVDDLTQTLSSIAKKQKKMMAENVKAGKDAMEGLGGLSQNWFEDEQFKKFLGSHPDTAEEQEDPFDNEDMDSILTDIKRDLSCNPNASALFRTSFKIDEDDAPDELLEAMAAALREDVMKMRQIIEEVIGPRPSLQTVVPRHMGRKEIMLLAGGVTPVFYPAFGPDEKPQGDVIIYVDVSGSMGDQAPFLLMLLTGFQNHISTEFYQFSTKIVATNFKEFRESFERTGEIFLQTTGGTNFDPILEHAQEQGYKKVLLITDGCASLSPIMRDFAQSIDVYTVFTINHNAEPLSEVSKRTWVMPSITVNKTREMHAVGVV